MLESNEALSGKIVTDVLDHFVSEYGLQSVTFLGGEPLLHKDIEFFCQYAAQRGLAVDVCTNGNHGFRRTVESLAPHLNRLRVSIDGMEASNDAIRKAGAFRSAMHTVRLARDLGVDVGATLTVSALNIHDVAPLANLLAQNGVDQLKLHALRAVGNAVQHPELMGVHPHDLAKLRLEIANHPTGIDIIYDSDLFAEEVAASTVPAETTIASTATAIERLEMDPRGGLTASCKAVGLNLNALMWDPVGRRVVESPSSENEFTLDIPGVRYIMA
jgi:MoaA/NifB/PqqE/SkfB family radical SAM enzyme